MSRRMWAFAVAAWVAVVIAGSGLTWIAIERAGDQVTVAPESADATRPPVLGTLGPAPTSGSTAPTGTPAATPPVVTRSPSSGPATQSTRPGPTTAPTTSPSEKSSPQPAARTEVRTWSAAPGSLTVACTGAQLSFRSASPSNGWSLERDEPSGSEIEVTFKSGESEVQVRATCSGGAPQFRVESDSDHD